MHISPQAADVRACDRFGIVQVCPAGDREFDPVNDSRLKPEVAVRQWEQRTEVMRATMIYFRNSPSILFWEAGNQVVTVPHMEEMVALRKKWDPNGGRVIGTRHGDDNVAATALTPVSEYYGVMIGQDQLTDELATPTAVFRGYSAERRGRAPLIETEDFRDEARVDFAVKGLVIWRGGLNSALENSTNNLYLNTKCGINREAIRSTLTPGTITVTATRPGLTPATVKIESKPVEIIGGLMRVLPPTFPGPRSAAKKPLPEENDDSNCFCDPGT